MFFPSGPQGRISVRTDSRCPRFGTSIKFRSCSKVPTLTAMIRWLVRLKEREGETHRKCDVHLSVFLTCAARAFSSLLLPPRLLALLLSVHTQRLESRVIRHTLSSTSAHVKSLICPLERQHETRATTRFRCTGIGCDDRRAVAQYRPLVFYPPTINLSHIDEGKEQEGRTHEIRDRPRRDSATRPPSAAHLPDLHSRPAYKTRAPPCTAFL
jgi:hypothetical protein